MGFGNEQEFTRLVTIAIVSASAQLLIKIIYLVASHPLDVPTVVGICTNVIVVSCTVAALIWYHFTYKPGDDAAGDAKDTYAMPSHPAAIDDYVVVGLNERDHDGKPDWLLQAMEDRADDKKGIEEGGGGTFRIDVAESELEETKFAPSSQLQIDFPAGAPEDKGVDGSRRLHIGFGNDEYEDVDGVAGVGESKPDADEGVGESKPDTLPDDGADDNGVVWKAEL